jgi:hypothetical protein
MLILETSEIELKLLKNSIATLLPSSESRCFDDACGEVMLLCQQEHKYCGDVGKVGLNYIKFGIFLDVYQNSEQLRKKIRTTTMAPF